MGTGRLSEWNGTYIHGVPIFNSRWKEIPGNNLGNIIIGLRRIRGLKWLWPQSCQCR